MFTYFFFHNKGLREYTKAGYESAAKRFNPVDLDVDLSNKAIMITGSNSGIGKSTALEGKNFKLDTCIYMTIYLVLIKKIVAKRGAVVYMVCRSKERGEAAQKEIIEQSKNDVIFVFF